MRFWLGLTDKVSEGRFVLESTGSVPSFTNWATNEPNDHGDGEDCSEIYTSGESLGKWNDQSCSDDIGTICEASSTSKFYTGTASMTSSGRPCQMWSSTTPHNHAYTSVGHHNYCRNPDGAKAGPWCYTTDPSKEWEYCAVPSCDKGATNYVFLKRIFPRMSFGRNDARSWCALQRSNI